jgi:hypothetical protein
MRHIKLDVGERVRLKWIDSRPRAGWVKVGELVPLGVIKSTGYVVASTESHLTITTSLQADNSYAHDPLSIPWSSIKSLSV